MEYFPPSKQYTSSDVLRFFHKYTSKGLRFAVVGWYEWVQILTTVFAGKKKQVSCSTESVVLDSFKRMARNVPAYKKFLAAHNVDPSSVCSPKDIARIPLMDKSNYLRKYPYAELFWNGTLEVPHTMTATSGSTGDPFYFARSSSVDEQSALIHEQFFLRSSLSKTKPTLVIVCFGMGVWIGGLLTYQAFQLLHKRKYPFSIITPGINKGEILKTLRLLAPQYEQILFAGYPPFIKDIIDEAIEAEIPLTKYRIAVIFAAEAFSEQFREYICKKAGIHNLLTDTMNIYGSADIGSMAFETPLSILVRRLAIKTPALFADIFGDITKTPTLAQFDPSFVAFEEVEGQVVISGNSAMPLVRYALGDQGGVRSFSTIEALALTHGIVLKDEMAAAGISSELSKLPFTFVFERSDLSTTLYGLQIYPETIREVLQREEYAAYITGRFTLLTVFDEKQDQYLEINIELRRDVEATTPPSLDISVELLKNLKLKNGEFKELYAFLGSRAEPRLQFLPYEDPRYFRRDAKQKWVVKTLGK